MKTVEDLTAEIKGLRATIAERRENVPNLRDYGFAKRDQYEADVAAYHAETQRLHERMQSAGYLRLALTQVPT